MVSRLSSLIALLRPQQWVKNSFVGAGAVFGGQFHNSSIIGAMLLAVAAFSLMGSCVYIINDFFDRTADARHPIKRHRPLASGALSPSQGFAVALVCFVLSIAAAWLADPRVLLIVLIYAAINVAYSVRLKHQPVIDVFCIATGFMLRIIAGSWGIHIPPSGWLLLTGMFITLFLGFAKRRAEWRDASDSHSRRPVLSVYSPELLDSFLSITATGTVLSYGLYTLDESTIRVHHTDKLIYTLPLVLFGLFRYLFLLHRHRKGENPSEDVFTDRQTLLCIVAYATLVLWLLNR